MQNTAQFLDALRAKLDLPSDGRLADKLGMHRQHISRYRTLEGTFDDEKSYLVAEILEIDPAYVIACMHHQRAKEPKIKAVWERMAVAMAAVAAVLVAVVGLPVQMHGFEYAGLVGSLALSRREGGQCILCKIHIENNASYYFNPDYNAHLAANVRH